MGDEAVDGGGEGVGSNGTNGTSAAPIENTDLQRIVVLLKSLVCVRLCVCLCLCLSFSQYQYPPRHSLPPATSLPNMTENPSVTMVFVFHCQIKITKIDRTPLLPMLFVCQM